MILLLIITIVLADAIPILETTKPVYHKSHESVELILVKQELDSLGLHGSELEGLHIFQAPKNLHHVNIISLFIGVEGASLLSAYPDALI